MKEHPMTETELSGLQYDNARLERPLFHCSWQRALFLHYRVAPQFLQKQIPFELDLHDGDAYVSLVAFTLRNMRVNHPRLRFLTQPLHTHAFLNVRTYVRLGELRGIYFLAEWLNNRLATMLGPVLYGLPYRFGKLNYYHDFQTISGQVLGGIGSGTQFGGADIPVRLRAKPAKLSTRPMLRYRASLPSCPIYEPAVPNTLDHFLLERYIAFTKHGPLRRLFHVSHDPWPQTPVNAQIDCDTLLQTTGRWFVQAQFAGANFSPGLSDVQMGWPQRVGHNCGEDLPTPLD
jgi:uncharacterized protein YqjF (DUF2071 family)